MPSAKLIKGDNLIYHFLHDLVEAEDEGKRVVPLSVIQDMLRVTGIWFPLNAYSQVPVLLPHVVRDASCRGNAAKGIPDQWNAPDERGFVRDDNSRLKGIPRSLVIKAPTEGRLRDAKMGSEFVASHIWRVTNEQGVLASKQPMLNSFIPNLVWLPRQISKLTDREGGIVQQTLQAMSWQIFRHAPVAPELEEVVEQAWSLLPPPSIEVQNMNSEDLNWFVSSEAFVERRMAAIKKVRDALMQLHEDGTVVPKFESRRYVEGITGVSEDARQALITHLGRFLPVAR